MHLLLNPFHLLPQSLTPAAPVYLINPCCPCPLINPCRPPQSTSQLWRGVRSSTSRWVTRTPSLINPCRPCPLSLTLAAALSPVYQPALEGRAVVNLQMGDTYAAFQDISASVRVRPTAELLTNRGVVQQASHRHQGAVLLTR